MLYRSGKGSVQYFDIIDVWKLLIHIYIREMIHKNMCKTLPGKWQFDLFKNTKVEVSSSAKQLNI